MLPSMSPPGHSFESPLYTFFVAAVDSCVSTVAAQRLLSLHCRLLTEGKQCWCPLSRWLHETPGNMLSMLEHHGGTVKGSVFRSSPSEASGTGTGKNRVMPRPNGLENPFASDQIQPKLVA